MKPLMVFDDAEQKHGVAAMNPLVSIMTPCYNSAKTLPLALASLIAQDHENWECVVVDDGSTDDPRKVVERANDPRIRILRFDENRGRAVARQAALDAARGEYLAMLDADDWMYPWRIRREIEAMEAEPKLTVVSAGMAIVDERNDIVGVRCTGSSSKFLGPFNALAAPPIAHAPSMIKMNVAKQYNYDPGFMVAQDVDFLLQVLLDRCYWILPEVNYVYSEHGSVTPEKILKAHRFWRGTLAKHRARFPLASRVEYVKSLFKSAAYRAAFALGLKRAIISSRSRRPTAEEVAEFSRARETVYAVAKKVFGEESLRESGR